MNAIREAMEIVRRRCALSPLGGLHAGAVALSLSLPLVGCVEQDITGPPALPASSTGTTTVEAVESQPEKVEQEVVESSVVEQPSATEAQSDELAPASTPVVIDVPNRSNPYAAVATERIRLERAELPDIDFADLTFPAADEAHVEALIASLAELDKPDFGLSSTLSGTTFLPLPGREEIGTVLLTDHRIESSGALVELVKLGPTALPALLAHLDDKTPTKLEIEHDFGIGGMWFANELRGNPLNATENEFLRNHELLEDSVDEYTVKVGDVCLVAIGQITGRNYKAVRYQPSLCIVLNSPTHDAGLCEQVRQIWGGEDPRRRYFDFLLLDYAARGRYVDTNESELYWSSDFQCSAATRLLYYFPETFGPVIAARIDGFDLSPIAPDAERPHEPPAMTPGERNEKNEVVTGNFLEAVAWSDHPAVVAALQRATERTTDEGVRELLKSRATPAPDTSPRSAPESSPR